MIWKEAISIMFTEMRPDCNTFTSNNYHLSSCKGFSVSKGMNCMNLCECARKCHGERTVINAQVGAIASSDTARTALHSNIY